MKDTTKRTIGLVVGTVFTITTVIGLPIIFQSCDNGTQTQPDLEKYQGGDVTIPGLEGIVVRVEGNLTDKELANAIALIGTAFYNEFNNLTELGKNSFEQMFKIGVTIILEKDPVGYTKYKTTRGKIDKIYINFGILNDAETLAWALLEAMWVMLGDNAPEFV